MDDFKVHGFYKSRLFSPLIREIHDRVVTLVANKHQVNEIFLSQCAWDLVRLSNDMFMPSMVPSGDVVLFYRSNDTDFSGFVGAHRDMPDAVVAENETPGSCVVWISITKASPSTSCLSVLPAEYDEHYSGGFNLEVNPKHLDKIECIVTEPGDVVVLSNRVLHWGTAHKSKEARISFSFVLVDAARFPLFCNVSECYVEGEYRQYLLSTLALWYFYQHPTPISLLKRNINVYKKARRTPFIGSYVKNGLDLQMLEKAISAFTYDSVRLCKRGEVSDWDEDVMLDLCMLYH